MEPPPDNDTPNPASQTTHDAALMCTLAFAWDDHPRYRFVFAGNRDEFHARPAAAAAWWPDENILAGRDLAAGGTWLGVTRSGRFAVVTNFREGDRRAADTRTRGELVTRYLQSTATDHFREQLDGDAARYSGYNLVFGELGNALYYHSNRGRSGGVTPGLHGMSNHLLDTPWPKVNRATGRLAELLAQPGIQYDDLFGMLSDRTPAHTCELPDTGVGPEMEKLLSSTFIVSPDYGTRCATAILLDHDGLLQFAERRFDCDGNVCGESRFEFEIR